MSSEHTIILHLPDPIGWIALSPNELTTARAKAGPLTKREDNGHPSSDASTSAKALALLSPDDAARVLAVDPSWLLKRAREGTIPHVRLGKYVRFDPVAIIEFGQRAKDAKP